MIKRFAVVDQDKCVACGSCIKICPRQAITVFKGMYAIVDQEKCVGCGICVKECPASVISIYRGELKNEK